MQSLFTFIFVFPSLTRVYKTRWGGGLLLLPNSLFNKEQGTFPPYKKMMQKGCPRDFCWKWFTMQWHIWKKIARIAKWFHEQWSHLLYCQDVTLLFLENEIIEFFVINWVLLLNWVWSQVDFSSYFTKQSIALCHNLSCWVLSLFEFVSFVTIWVFKCCHFLS